MKHPIKTLIIVVSSLFLYNSASASDWVLIKKDSETSEYIDRDSIKVKNDIVSYWVNVEFQKPQTIGRGIFIISKGNDHIDCKEKKFGVTSVIYYNKDGNVVYSHHYPLEWEPIVPDSPTDFLFKQLCK